MNLFLFGFLVGGAVTLCLDWAIREYQIRRDRKVEIVFDSYESEMQGILRQANPSFPVGPKAMPKMGLALSEQEERVKDVSKAFISEVNKLPDGFVRASPEQFEKLMEPQIHPNMTLPEGVTYTKIQKPGRHRKE